MTVHYDVSGDIYQTAGEASTNFKKLLMQLGIPAHVIKRTVISMYEAEINMIIHAGGGIIDAEILPEKIRIRVKDTGPGIPDIELAMQEGYSTAPDYIREMGFGAGMGLPNIKRNSDEMTVESEIGKGTTVTIVVHV